MLHCSQTKPSRLGAHFSYICCIFEHLASTRCFCLSAVERNSPFPNYTPLPISKSIKSRPSAQKYNKCMKIEHLASTCRFCLWAVERNSEMGYSQPFQKNFLPSSIYIACLAKTLDLIRVTSTIASPKFSDNFRLSASLRATFFPRFFLHFVERRFIFRPRAHVQMSTNEHRYINLVVCNVYFCLVARFGGLPTSTWRGSSQYNRRMKSMWSRESSN